MGASVFRTSLFQAGIATVVVLSSLSLALAQVRTSPSYQLQSESVNIGGGLSSSTNYQQESTVGEVATGDSDSPSYRLRAGYQQMQEVYLSISTPDNVLMTGSLPGITGGESNGSTTVHVLTDSPSGYQVTIQAEAAPAMRKGVDTIADYIPDSAPEADFIFTTAVNEAHFGFSPQGPDAAPYFLNDGDECGSGSQSTLLRCWDGLTITPSIIAVGAGANHPIGATTTLQFKVGLGGGIVVPPGTYVATTTLTALPL